MKKFLFLILSVILIPNAQSTRLCSDVPQGLPDFNPDWFYSEFTIPENYQVTSLYGGFERPGYITAHHDYIAQFYTAGQSITGLNDYQLFNYDLIDEPLYNREYSIEHLNVRGAGTLRLSAPLTHGVIWNQVCVTISEAKIPEAVPEAVPEPSTFAMLAMGILAIGAISRTGSRRVSD